MFPSRNFVEERSVRKIDVRCVLTSTSTTDLCDKFLSALFAYVQDTGHIHMYDVRVMRAAFFQVFVCTEMYIFVHVHDDVYEGCFPYNSTYYFFYGKNLPLQPFNFQPFPTLTLVYAQKVAHTYYECVYLSQWIL